MLTAKQEAFCFAYVETSDASAAYRSAYDTSKSKLASIWVAASKLLASPEIAARVKEIYATRETRLHERYEMTIEQVKAEYGKIALANMFDYVAVQENGTAYVDLSAVTREQAAAISEITVDEYVEGRGEDGRAVKKVKIKLHSKLGALDSVARVLGMFKDKTEHTGKDGAPLVPESASPRDLARVILDILRGAKMDDRGDG